MAKTVGRFSIEGSTFTGPQEYMAEQGNARLERILSGNDSLFNATAYLSPDLETAILVWMQTDYAAWAGARELTAMSQRASARY